MAAAALTVIKFETKHDGGRDDNDNDDDDCRDNIIYTRDRTKYTQNKRAGENERTRERERDTVVVVVVVGGLYYYYYYNRNEITTDERQYGFWN